MELMIKKLKQEVQTLKKQLLEVANGVPLKELGDINLHDQGSEEEADQKQANNEQSPVNSIKNMKGLEALQREKDSLNE